MGKHIGSLYFEPSHHRHMGGKGENNMSPRGRHLIETKDQKMCIMSIVQKKRIRKHHIHRTTGKQDERGKKSWSLRGGRGRETPRNGTLKIRTSSPLDHWQVWKQTIRRQESRLEPGIIHTERYTCIRFQCGCSPIELSCPLCSNGKHHTGHECQF